MIKSSVAVTGMLGTWLFLTSTALGQTSEGPAEKAGEKIDGAVRIIKRGVANASKAVRERFARVRTSVHNMELESRIYSRLHWDKALTTAALEVEVQGGNTAILRGTVTDAHAKAKTLSLTAETVGVVQIVDQLAVQPPPRVVPVPPSQGPAVKP